MAQRGRSSQREDQVVAQVGGVTLSQIPLGVYVDGERRNLPIYGPGGYCWRPKVGEQVVVLKTSGGDCVIGCHQQESDLAAGEIKLAVDGGGEIHLTADGQVALAGTLTLNGEDLEAMVQRLVLANLPSE